MTNQTPDNAKQQAREKLVSNLRRKVLTSLRAVGVPTPHCMFSVLDSTVSVLLSFDDTVSAIVHALIPPEARVGADAWVLPTSFVPKVLPMLSLLGINVGSTYTDESRYLREVHGEVMASAPGVEVTSRGYEVPPLGPDGEILN